MAFLPYRWLPRSLLGRIFALLSACVLIFTLAGLLFIHHHHTTQEVEDANESIETLADTLLPTMSDSAVIGDYDTIQRTLNRAVRGKLLSQIQFVDSQGIIVKGESDTDPDDWAPAWLTALVADRLHPIRREITVGGKGYGHLTLHISPHHIAADIWMMSRAYLIFALLLLFPGLYLARIPLRAMVADLKRTAQFATELKDHSGSELRLDSTTIETGMLADALNRVSRELSFQHQALIDSESRKGAILSASLDCFITINEEGRIIDFNRAAETTFGYRAEGVQGQLLSELIIPPELRADHEQGMAHWRQTGEGPVLNRRIEITAMRSSGDLFPVELTVVPFASGDRHYFAGFIREITEQRTLETERNRVTQLLEKSVRELEYQKFALDQHAIVSIADAQGLITYANAKFTEISGYSREELLGQNHRLIKSGLHSDDYYEAMWTSICQGNVWHGEIANRSKEGKIYWVASTIVPWLGSDGLPYQYVSIRTDITAQKMTEQALAAARLRELETGYEIQRTLLFGGMPEDIHGAQIATYTEPSQGIDGDFYAITRFDPDCFEILMGDVMGKGVPAALIGAAVKSAYHMVLAELFAKGSNAGRIPEPEDVINAMHRILTSRLVELNSFATLALYRFDRKVGRLIYVNAGHPPGLLVRAGGRIEEVRGDNLPIGVLAEEHYRQIEIEADTGDSLLVYSDGITEAHDGHRAEFGHERLVDLVTTGFHARLPPTALLQSLRQEVRRFVGSDLLRDDQTALMITLRPLRTSSSRRIEDRIAPDLLILPWRLDGLAPLRQRIRECAALMPEEAVDALTLASFEATTNILRHSQPYFVDATLACRISPRPGELMVELIYPGPTFTPPDNPQADFSGDSEGGFGLFIIQQSVDLAEYLHLAPGISSIRLTKRFRPQARTTS